MLTINASLAITTTALPNGTQGTAYSQQLAATGGVPPYTWALDPTVQLPPSPLTLNTAGVLSGTPAGPSTTTSGYIVTDSANKSAEAKLSLLINPLAAAPLTGTYSFMFGGTPPRGTSANQAAIALDGTFTVANGVVQSGEFDENSNGGGPLLQQAISGGTLTNYSDGLGQLVLDVPGGTVTFSLAIPATGADIRMIEYDDTTGTGTRGSGVLKAAATTPAPTTGLTGSYALQISGADPNGRQQALVASLAMDGNGNITGGSVDSNQVGTVIVFDPPSGTYAVDAQGRGLLHLTLTAFGQPPFTFNYSFYQVSPTEWMIMSIDQATTNAPVVIGPVYQQSGAPYSAASLAAGNYVLGIHGLALASSNQTVPDVTAGIGVSDGVSSLNFTYDEYNGTLATAQSLPATYTVANPATGRVTTTVSSSPGPILYLIDSTRAFVLGADGSASSGLLELQTGNSFTNTSFSGNYLGGSLPLAAPPSLNEAGLVQPDGQGNIVLTTNRSAPTGLSLYQYLTGTYTTDSTGRVVVTTLDGDTRIFYIVSPNKATYLTSDTGGYLGSFEQ